MSRLPDDPAGTATGPPDRQTLRLLETQLESETLVDETAYEPDVHEPRVLQAVLDTDQYPSSVQLARLDIRWFTTGDFSLHYIETQTETECWECRWDRHPNPHNARLHFHQPPSAETVTDLSLSSLHPLDVCSTVLTAVDQRLETVWTA